MATKHTENIEGCKSIFITWYWALTAFAASVVIISTMSFGFGAQTTEIKKDLKTTIERVDDLDKKYDEMVLSNSNKLDTLIKLIKSGSK